MEMQLQLEINQISSILYDNPFQDLKLISVVTLFHTNFQQNQVVQSKKKQSTYMKKWSIEQNQIYLKCLSENTEAFVCQFNRRSEKIFKKMAQEMNGMRTSEQCRGHHKKMVENYGSPYQIQKKVRAKIRKAAQKLVQLQKRALKKVQRSTKNIQPQLIFDLHDQQQPHLTKQSNAADIPKVNNVWQNLCRQNDQYIIKLQCGNYWPKMLAEGQSRQIQSL